jgi:hypothetical protein
VRVTRVGRVIGRSSGNLAAPTCLAVTEKSEEVKLLVGVMDDRGGGQFTTDQRDFIEAMAGLNPTMGQYARECSENGTHPKDIATGFAAAAEKARSWCIGRFG